MAGVWANPPDKWVVECVVEVRVVVEEWAAAWAEPRVVEALVARSTDKRFES